MLQPYIQKSVGEAMAQHNCNGLTVDLTCDCFQMLTGGTTTGLTFGPLSKLQLSGVDGW